MTFTTETIVPQVAQLLNEYPDLVVVQSDAEVVRLTGRILVFRSYNDFPVRKIYTLEIVIPIGSDQLPYVIDIDRQIRQDYQHYYYQNGMLCLETDSKIRIRFINGFDLVAWMSEFVELYYFSYEYYERYCSFPFGDRSHGPLGVLQAYKDLLIAKDEVETYKLMRFIKNNEYRGHHLCPCGSERSLRNCHGQAMLQFYKDARAKIIMIDDLKYINRELAKGK